MTNSGIYSTVADRRHVRLWSKGTMKKKRKGFTLAELLIVVAIIAVLVAIGIPIFTSQLEKSREQTRIFFHGRRLFCFSRQMRSQARAAPASGASSTVPSRRFSLSMLAPAGRRLGRP